MLTGFLVVDIFELHAHYVILFYFEKYTFRVAIEPRRFSKQLLLGLHYIHFLSVSLPKELFCNAHVSMVEKSTLLYVHILDKSFVHIYLNPS